MAPTPTIGAAVFVVITLAASGPRQGTSLPSNQPHVIRADDQHHTPIGLVYSPELLTALVAQSPEPPGQHIAQVISHQTPVVLVWSVPVPQEVGTPVPPYKVVIEADAPGGNRVDPIWLAHDATELARLDRQVGSQTVGAIAAFPRSALIAGRLVCLYADYPPDYERKVHRQIRRCGRIE
jgi:hypothetical protein